jgi:hypothetical protein
MEVGRVDVVVAAGIDLPQVGEKSPRVRRQIMNGLAREPNHAIQRGEKNGGQLAQSRR